MTVKDNEIQITELREMLAQVLTSNKELQQQNNELLSTVQSISTVKDTTKVSNKNTIRIERAIEENLQKSSEIGTIISNQHVTIGVYIERDWTWIFHSIKPCEASMKYLNDNGTFGKKRFGFYFETKMDTKKLARKLVNMDTKSIKS